MDARPEVRVGHRSRRSDPRDGVGTEPRHDVADHDQANPEHGADDRSRLATPPERVRQHRNVHRENEHHDPADDQLVAPGELVILDRTSTARCVAEADQARSCLTQRTNRSLVQQKKDEQCDRRKSEGRHRARKEIGLP
jgi:hypothetical protein